MAGLRTARLLQRWPPVTASVILGLVWAAWHLGLILFRGGNHINDLPPRVWPPVHPLGGPASNRQVAVIGDPNSVRAECFQQPSLPKRCGALLDPRPMGGNARRHTEHTPRTGAGFCLTRHSHTIDSRTRALVICTSPIQP